MTETRLPTKIVRTETDSGHGGTVWVHPRYRGLVQQCGLRNPQDFLNLRGQIVSGHPDRHVVQVRIGSDCNAFLKREHRVRWRDRLLNALAGFGLVSRSIREARILQDLRRAGIGCPDVIAAGEGEDGQAFLLLGELSGTRGLSPFLRELPPDRRGHWAAIVGEAVAQVHEAGFDHPDLYSKHVLIDPERETVHFLDWQRTCWRPYVGWGQRWRDLAALHATIGDSQLSVRDRLRFLKAYLRVAIAIRPPPGFLKEAARAIALRSRRLLRHRHVQEIRNLPLTQGKQNLVWLDGEALCVTAEFHARHRGELPTWLVHLLGHPGARDQRPLSPCLPGRSQVTRTVVCGIAGPSAVLTRRTAYQPVQWLASLLTRRRPTTPELKTAGLLFRLQRYGVAGPQLLAMGHRRPRPWRTESFLLTESPAGTVGLVDFLRELNGRPLWTVERKLRSRLIREAGVLLRRMHAANCYFTTKQSRNDGEQVLPIQVCLHGAATLLLGSVEEVICRRRPSKKMADRNLAALLNILSGAGCSRTDRLRCRQSYLSFKSPDA